MQLDLKTKYAFIGASFGSVFPLAAWTWDIVTSDLVFTPAAVTLIHQNNFLHYVIDLAPFALGLSFFFVAVSRQVIRESAADLKKHAAKVTLLLNSTGEAIYGIDLNGDCIFANTVCIEILGYQSEAELLFKNMHDLIHHTHNDGTPYAVEECKIYRAFKLGIGSHVDDEVLWRKDGSSFDAEYRSFPMREDDKIIGSVVSFTDITERKILEREREQLGAELTKLLDNANAPIFELDTSLKISKWNLAVERITGYTKNEVMGRSFINEFIDDAFKEGVSKIFEDALAGTETSNFELYMRTKKDGIAQILFNTTTRRDLTGETTGVMGIGQDLTETIAALAESERVAANLALLLNTIDAPIFGIDANGKLNEWNSKATEITGYSKEEVMGQDMVPKIFPREHWRRIRLILSKALAGEATTNAEIPVCLKDGGTRLLLFNATTQRDLNGEITGAIGVAQDITELRAKENALNQAQKMQAVGQLTGGIAHDFNNLLSVIGGNLRFLRQDIGEVSDEINELFEDAQSAVDDGAELTQRLLGFSRIRGLQPQLKNVNEIIPKFVRFLSRTIGENISLRLVLPEQALCVNVDPSQLENALLNLTINARDALSGKGQLVIRVDAVHIEKDQGTGAELLIDGDYVKISVIDRGKGIAPEVIDHVFEPFFTTKAVGEGSGLGLSMVYGFTQQSGGACVISSTLGEGTTVSMFLPKVSDAGTYNTDMIKAIRTFTGNEKILVVEDETRVRRVVVRDLENLGYLVLQAENAEKAIKVMGNDTSINMLFTDVLMPGVMDGRDLAEWTIVHYPDIKILLTSGFSKSNSDYSPSELRPLAMLRKPYAIEKLAKQIRSTLLGKTPDFLK